MAPKSKHRTTKRVALAPQDPQDPEAPRAPPMVRIERTTVTKDHYYRPQEPDWRKKNVGWNSNNWWTDNSWQQTRTLDHEKSHTWYSSSSEDPENAPDDDSLILVNNGSYPAGKSKKEDDKDKPKIVSFRPGDPANPYNWSTARKLWIVFVGSLTVVNSTIGSSLPSNAEYYISKEFDETNEQRRVLPITLFLVGYVFGPLIFAPISEATGRKWVTWVSFFVYMVFTMACALTPNYAALVVFRFLCGTAASAPIVVTGGIYADIYNDPIQRGRAMALYMAATTCGPLISPILSGYCGQNPSLGWRWTFWIALIIAGGSCIPLALLPETFGPIILTKRAKRWRKETGDDRYISQHEIQMRERTFKQTLNTLLLRPVHMLFTEPIVLSTSLYLSIAYAILYMFFSGAYGVVFTETYGLSFGVSGLMFLPIGGGVLISLVLFLIYERFYIHCRNRGKNWTRKEEAQRVPLAFLGGPLYVIALFWLGWTGREDVPWVVPMLAGIPFGMGFLLIFMALMNYLTDAYEVFAASALAATSMCRSVFGALMPLAAERMYHVMGIDWASSTLGFIALAMSLIPFCFFIWGDKIRSASPFCQELRRKKEENARGGN